MRRIDSAWCVAMALTFGLGGPFGSSAWAQDEGPGRLPRRITVTAATAEPITIERTVAVYDTSQPVRVRLQIVMSQPLAAKRGGLLGDVELNEDPEQSDAWLRGAHDRLREAAVARYREATGNEKGDPAIAVRYNDARRGLDYTADLRELDYTQVSRLNNGAGVWAALFAREERNNRSKLGEATERLRVQFKPTVSPNGAVEIGAISESTIEPVAAPRGVDAAVWEREIARRRKGLDVTGQMLTRRLNLMRIRAPLDAAGAFEKKQTYDAVRSVPLWGAEREYTVRMTGKTALIKDGPIGPADGPKPVALTQENWRKQLAGEWVITMDHQRAGRIFGHLSIDAESSRFDGLRLVLPSREEFMMNGGIGMLGYSRGSLSIDVLGLRYPLAENPLSLPIDQVDGGPMTWRLAVDEPRSNPRAGAFDMEMTWRRPKPTVDRITVRPNGDAALSFDAAKKAWAANQKVEVELTLWGSDLPRVANAPVGELKEYPVLRMIRCTSEDDKMIVEYARGTGDGERMTVYARLLPGFKPGPKKFTVGGLPLTVDPLAQDAVPPDPRVIALSLAVSPKSLVGIVPDPDTGMQRFVLTAVYEREPVDATRSARVWVERAGRPVYRVPDGALVLPRVEGGFPRMWEYRGEFDIPANAAGIDGKPFRLQPGDVLMAEFEGASARLAPMVWVNETPTSVPIVHFSIDEDGIKGLQEAIGPDGRFAQFLPVGQRFWVHARYLDRPTDPVKKLKMRWAGGEVELELKLIKPTVGVYRGGPYFVKPPADAAADDATPKPDSPAAPEPKPDPDR